MPKKSLTTELSRFKEAEIIWCQEEPKNMGSWFFIEPLLREAGHTVKYAGRAAAASPATGSHKRHAREQALLMSDALGITIEAGH